VVGTPEVIDRLRAVLGDDTFAVRFEVEREVGRGGMGSVHRAIDRGTRQPVAIKLVHAASLQARFTLEAETLERLAHPAIVSYVGHGVMRDGGAYLAMTWLDGENLADRLARGALSIADTLAAGIRVAGALAHAHAEGIVHRDIKPSNVMLVDKDPRKAMLIDFGIAKDTAVAHGLTETGQLVGTPG
jgi:eukaryotic-like serine/threonine-protein kinase